MVVMPLGPQLRRTLRHHPVSVRPDRVVYTISAGLAGLLASSVLDRFGRKQAFLTLYCGFLVGTLLCGLSFNYYSLLLARIVTGAFGGILGGMALAIIGDVFPEERRGRATGVLMSAFALASVVGVPVVSRSRHAVRLAVPIPAAGGSGRARSFRGREVSAPASRPSGRPGPCSSLEANSRHLQRGESSAGLRADFRDHVRRVLGHPLHQYLPGLERGSHREESDARLRDRWPAHACGRSA